MSKLERLRAAIVEAIEDAQAEGRRLRGDENKSKRAHLRGMLAAFEAVKMFLDCDCPGCKMEAAQQAGAGKAPAAPVTQLISDIFAELFNDMKRPPAGEKAETEPKQHPTHRPFTVEEFIPHRDRWLRHIKDVENGDQVGFRAYGYSPVGLMRPGSVKEDQAWMSWESLLHHMVFADDLSPFGVPIAKPSDSIDPQHESWLAAEQAMNEPSGSQGAWSSPAEAAQDVAKEQA